MFNDNEKRERHRKKDIKLIWNGSGLMNLKIKALSFKLPHNLRFKKKLFVSIFLFKIYYLFKNILLQYIKYYENI